MGGGGLVSQFMWGIVVGKCSLSINEKKLHSNEINDYEKICSSCSGYIVFLIIFFILNVYIST